MGFACSLPSDLHPLDNLYVFILQIFTCPPGHTQGKHGEVATRGVIGKFREFRTPIPGDSGQRLSSTFHFSMIR